jgi:hypothetical protein
MAYGTFISRFLGNRSALFTIFGKLIGSFHAVSWSKYLKYRFVRARVRAPLRILLYMFSGGTSVVRHT